MPEVIHSSFIPKKEFKKKASASRGGGINVFLLIALIVFLSTIIGSVGVYLWKKDLEKTNQAKKEAFLEYADYYGIETIKAFSDLSSRIKIGRELLKKHYNILPIFAYLEQYTLKDIVLSNFSLVEQGDKLVVNAKGTAPDLPDVYLQSQAYSENPNIEDLILSDVARSKGGNVTFSLTFKVDKKYLTLKRLLPD